MRFSLYLKRTVFILAVVLVGQIGYVPHSSTMMHGEIGNEAHSSDNAVQCSTLCRSAVLDNVTVRLQNTDENEDDDPTPPYAALLSSVSNELSDKLTKQALYAKAVKPPPKIPLYLRYQVLRV